MDKTTLKRPYNGIQISNNNTKTNDMQLGCRSKAYMLSEKTQSENITYYIVPFI